MRIAVVCPYGLDVPGGVQGQAMGMARAFAVDHEVTLFGPGASLPSVSKTRALETVLLGPTTGVHANGSVAPIALFPRSALALWRELRARSPELVIVHEPLVPLLGWASLARRSSVTVGVFHRAGGLPGLRLLSPLVSASLSHLQAGAVVSSEARKAIASLIGARANGFEEIPNAIDIGRFEVAGQLRRTERSVLFVGRHERRKGLGVLLAAMDRLPEGYRLEVVGAGPQTEELRAGLVRKERVTWLGRVSDEELALRLASTEIFVAPSLGGESFGVVLLEAMAAGTPVICSDLAGYRSAAGDVARYVPPGDPEALAGAVVHLSGDPDSRAQASMAGLARAQLFSFDSLARRYLEIYSSIAATRSS